MALGEAVGRTGEECWCWLCPVSQSQQRGEHGHVFLPLYRWHASSEHRWKCDSKRVTSNSVVPPFWCKSTFKFEYKWKPCQEIDSPDFSCGNVKWLTSNYQHVMPALICSHELYKLSWVYKGKFVYTSISICMHKYMHPCIIMCILYVGNEWMNEYSYHRLINNSSCIAKLFLISWRTLWLFRRFLYLTREICDTKCSFNRPVLISHKLYNYLECWR